MWLKYTHRWAYGGDFWEWIYLGEGHPDKIKGIAEDIVSELKSECSYDNYYRGVYYELIETASDDVVNNLIEVEQQKIKQSQKLILELENLKKGEQK